MIFILINAGFLRRSEFPEIRLNLRKTGSIFGRIGVTITSTSDSLVLVVMKMLEESHGEGFYRRSCTVDVYTITVKYRFAEMPDYLRFDLLTTFDAWTSFLA